MAKRTRKPETIYQITLKKMRKAANRHVLVLEAHMTETQKRRTFKLANKLRICDNRLTGEMQKRFDQLFRTKAYRLELKEYGRLSDKLAALDPKDEKYEAAREELDASASRLSAMQKKFDVTWDYARKFMETLVAKYNIPAVFALARAEDVWQGVECLLYGNGERLHFRKKGDFPIIRAKQEDRGIVACMKNGALSFSINSTKKKEGEAICGFKAPGKFGLKTPPRKDIFANQELALIYHYFTNADSIDKEALLRFTYGNGPSDTFRLCYAALRCEIIRGKLRVFTHLTVEGNPLPKVKLDRETGNLVPRHDFSKTGRLGGDIGPQTVAISSKDMVSLENLAERNGDSSKQYERSMTYIRRSMDRQRRAANPQNYNEDGTIKPRKDRLPWKNSKSYRKNARRLTEIERKARWSRKYANQEMANDIRAMGDEFITEPPNFKALQKKAKESRIVVDGDGKEHNTRRKRSGKTIYHRAPGGFQADLKKKFGGGYHEVDKMYRASQYDVTCGECVKKELSDRIYALSDGTMVQRDMYSAWLLRNSNWDYSFPNEKKCRSEFQAFLRMQAEAVNEIALSGRKICNSGITEKTRFAA